MTIGRTSARIGFLILGLLSFTVGAEAKVVYVAKSGSDVNDGLSWTTAKVTVQAGLNTAAAGDEIWVAAGVYFEKIMLTAEAALYGGFAGNETQLADRNWTANNTTLDGDAKGRVVTSPAGATSATRIDGFTIQHGNATSGGGIYCDSCSPTIAHNTIADNAASVYQGTGGAGIYCRNASPTITDNTITGNTASGASDCSGGGISCDDHSSPTISRNIITENRCYPYGGGISCRNSSPTISNNTISGNTATYGGAIYSESCSAVIVSNRISENAAFYGGGAYCYLCLSPTISDNLILGNTAILGGGMQLFNLTTGSIVNNTIAGNAASRGGGIYCQYGTPTITNTLIAFNSSGVAQVYGTPAFRHSCVYGNTDYDYSGMPDPTGTDGNISADPKLASHAYGNVHIQPGSPCKDAGDDAFSQEGRGDMDGQERIQGNHVDIGADESDSTAWPEGPYIIVRVSPEGDNANDGSSWDASMQSLQPAIDTASALGGEVWVKSGIYMERISVRPYVHLFGGFDGTETLRQQRSWRTHTTIVDGQAKGEVVTINQSGYLCNTIDGFTIRNGKAASGGGIACRCSSPVIANNVVKWNNASSYGGGIYCNLGSSRIVNTYITGNTASAGGGVYRVQSSAAIICDAIIGNSATQGGAVFDNGMSSIVTNTLVAFNSSGIKTGSTGCLSFNCVYGNASYNYSGVTDPTGTNGNIFVDPGFVRSPSPGADGVWATADDDPGDLHLKAGSPCIDAGSNAGVPIGILTDLDGLTRFVNDPATADTGLGTGPIVDIGAYEYIPGDFNRDGDIDSDDMKTFATCASGPAIPYAGDCGEADLDGDGDVDQSDFGVLQRCYSGKDRLVEPNCVK